MFTIDPNLVLYDGACFEAYYFTYEKEVHFPPPLPLLSLFVIQPSFTWKNLVKIFSAKPLQLFPIYGIIMA